MMMLCRGRSIARRCTIKGARMLSSPTTLAQNPPPSPGRRLPIGAFLDLDNIAPKTHRRSDTKEFVTPIIELGRRINRLPGHDAAEGGEADQILNTKRLLKKLDLRIEAFGNLSTRSWREEEEKERGPAQQEYIPWTGMEDDGAPGIAQTGYDQDGILRCGVCGAKMKLSKKDKKAGRTLDDKLFAHMKIHSKEQGKRLNKIKQKRKLNSKDYNRLKKYQAATVGLKLGKLVGSKTGRAVAKRRNDLFQVLKEVGVHVKAEDNVDAALITAADRWMEKVGDKNADRDVRGVVLVSSRDGDFEPLLRRARMRGFVTVTATDKDRQTRKLVRNSDIIVGPIKHWNEQTFSSSLLDDNYDDESSDDESDDSIDEDSRFEIRTIPSAPVGSMLSSLASPSDMTIRAIPVTDRGLEFMGDHGGSVNGDRDGGSSAVCWELVAREEGDSDKDVAAGNASKMKVPPSSMKQSKQIKQQTPRGKEVRDESLEILASKSENARGDGYAENSVNINSGVSSSSKQLERQHLPDIFRSKRKNSGAGKSSPAAATAEIFPVKKDARIILGKKIDGNLGKVEKRKLRRAITAEKLAEKLAKKFETISGEELSWEEWKKLPKWKRKKKKRRLAHKYFECKDCGDQVRHWAQFLDHMRACDHCPKKKIRRMGRENRQTPFEIFLETSGRDQSAR